MKRALIFMALFLAGCASQIMQDYVGHPISDVIADYGMPSGEFEVGKGEKAFVWNMDSTVVSPGTSFTNGRVVSSAGTFHSSTFTSPTVVSQDTCGYMLYAKRTRKDIEGPAAWTVTGFKKPRFECE